MKLLQETVAEGLFLLDLDARDLGSIIRAAFDELVEKGRLPAEQRDVVEAALLAREEEISTAIGHAVAVPHAYLDLLTEPIVIFVRLARPLNLGAPDGIPTRFLFVLLGPTGRAAEHLDTLTQIARLMSDDQFRFEAGEARDQRQLFTALERFTTRTSRPTTAVERPIPEGLTYTGRLFGGLLKDLRRRRPHYAADFSDGFHFKSLSSTLFLFFACLAPAVTFGGIMAELTDNRIGVVEMIVASAFCGVIYALFSGQPLIILGGTGPLLVFTWVLYIFCDSEHLDIAFLETRAWIGLWTALILIVLSVTDASCLMRYFTRFTDEIFAALITIIFIFTAVKSLADVFEGLEEKRHHDTALLSLLLALGTLYIATSLSRFRRSRYLVPWLREFLSDFGPAIALVVMTLVAVWMQDVELDSLIPKSHEAAVQPTLMVDTEGKPVVDAEGKPDSSIGEPRPWLIDLFAVPSWVWFASIAPALLVAILVYVDQNITARLVNSPDLKLKKGEAYHYDLAVMGVLIGVCSLFGLPWLVAATVRSLNHVRSLATVEEAVSSTGHTRERIIHVRETRLTGLAIHLLIGCSLLLLSVLQHVPMPVLYGLFLFMGVVSIAGNQFFERLSLWLTDPNLYPATHYIRRVPMSTIHKFTLLQFVCLAVLGFVEISPLGILFPLFVLMLVPVRLLAGRFFTSEHLEALDAEEEPEEEETHWSG